mmetsp:Transcript_29707/g.78854  ORF Transcript_29707/g.78854 Transcript_29707/m.78854 type:complete len:268 (+) Transcript_29707:206-1009(+)
MSNIGRACQISRKHHLRKLMTTWNSCSHFVHHWRRQNVYAREGRRLVLGNPRLSHRTKRLFVPRNASPLAFEQARQVSRIGMAELEQKETNDARNWGRKYGPDRSPATCPEGEHGNDHQRMQVEPASEVPGFHDDPEELVYQCEEDKTQEDIHPIFRWVQVDQRQGNEHRNGVADVRDEIQYKSKKSKQKWQVNLENCQDEPHRHAHKDSDARFHAHIPFHGSLHLRRKSNMHSARLFLVCNFKQQESEEEHHHEDRRRDGRRQAQR